VARATSYARDFVGAVLRHQQQRDFACGFDDFGKEGDLIEVYEISAGNVNIDHSHLLEQVTSGYDLRGHTMTL